MGHHFKLDVCHKVLVRLGVQVVGVDDAAPGRGWDGERPDAAKHVACGRG